MRLTGAEHKAIHTKTLSPWGPKVKYNLLYSKVKNVSEKWMLPEVGQPFLTRSTHVVNKNQTPETGDDETPINGHGS